MPRRASWNFDITDIVRRRGDEMTQKPFPWEESMGARCPVGLSIRCDRSPQTGEWSGDAAFESARAALGEFKAAYEQGGGCIYNPAKRSRTNCKVQRDSRWCLGECELLGGPPSDNSCWATSYGYLLDCLAGRHGHQRGVVLQVVERDRQLGQAQHEELAMAQKRGLPIYVCETQWQDLDGVARQTFIFHSGSKSLLRQDTELAPALGDGGATDGASDIASDAPAPDEHDERWCRRAPPPTGGGRAEEALMIGTI